VLPSPDDAASDHPGPEALVNTGSARETFVPIGSNLVDFDNYFCRDCRRIVRAEGIARFSRVPDTGMH